MKFCSSKQVCNVANQHMRENNLGCLTSSSPFTFVIISHSHQSLCFVRDFNCMPRSEQVKCHSKFLNKIFPFVCDYCCCHCGFLNLAMKRLFIHLGELYIVIFVFLFYVFLCSSGTRLWSYVMEMQASTLERVS
jgi:hypothetical protein